MGALHPTARRAANLARMAPALSIVQVGRIARAWAIPRRLLALALALATLERTT